MSVRETSASKPFDDASGQVCRKPDYWADDGRRIGGVKRTQAFVWNCMNQALDAKGEAVAAKAVRREYRRQGLGRTDP